MSQIDTRTLDKHQLLGEFQLFRSNNSFYIKAMHQGVWSLFDLDSEEFKLFVDHRYFAKHGNALEAWDQRELVAVLRAHAWAEGAQATLAHRVARSEEGIWIDLGDRGRAIHVTAEVIEVTDRCDVGFVRPSHYGRLPEPSGTGSVTDLRELINTRSEDDHILSVSWLLSALQPEGAKPILSVEGAAGAGKTFATTTLRAMVDPTSPPFAGLSTCPASPRDLYVATQNNWVLAIDNVDRLNDEMTTALCCVTTGSAFTARQLYTNHTENRMVALRPVVLNGLGGFVSRADVVSRSIRLWLPPIAPAARRTETAIREELRRIHGGVVGQLCSAVQTALRRGVNGYTGELPRMAEWAAYVVSGASAFGWDADRVGGAWKRNRARWLSDTVQCSPLLEALCTFAQAEESWQGTLKQLLERLGPIASRSDVNTPHKMRRFIESNRNILEELGCAVSPPGERVGNARRDRLVSVHWIKPTADPLGIPK